jgi:peptidoglycan/xylan/chitin deacetylase (PgdA/CDA1 family)
MQTRVTIYAQQSQAYDTNDRANYNHNKVVILTFGDTHKSQFTTAKPILDKYGFKASFFITCTYADDQNKTRHLSWDDISALQKDGEDIESKGMTPVDLNHVSSKALDFETANSKECLESHGINSPNIFAAKYGNVWNNRTVTDAISKYYDFADNGIASLMYLHCDGYKNKSPTQTDCRTYTDNGELTYANRYSIREWSHNARDKGYQHNDQVIFPMFIEEVNSGIAFNDKKGMLDAIPIIAYHSTDNSKRPFSTNIGLFEAELKYLYDNGFKVIPMSDLGYDQSTNYMYMKKP